MTREKLRIKIGLILEDFDRDPTADMDKFINAILENIDAHIDLKLSEHKKKVLIDYLEISLANQR